MTISSTTARNNYLGNNSTAVYSYTFKIFVASDLEVVRTTDLGVASTLTLNTDYTVSGVGNSSGGSVTLVAGNLPTNYLLNIRRVRPITQTTDIRNQGDFFAETHEDEFDKLTMVDQQQQDTISRAVQLPTSVDPASFNPALPTNIASNPGSAIIVNPAGTGLTLGINNSGTDASRVAKTGDSMSGDLSMLNGNGVKFYKTGSANSTKLKASDSISADEAYTLPPGFPASTKYLKSSSVGVFGFDSADDIKNAMTIAGLNISAMQNVGLATSVAASALTVTLSDAQGNALSSTNPAKIVFGSATATNGQSVVRSATSNLTITIPSGATLSSGNSVPDYIYIWAIDNAGTIELAISGAQFIPTARIVSSTTISAAASSMSTLYSTTGRSNVACRLLGRLLYTQTTAGTWASAGTTLELATGNKDLFYEIGSFTANFNQQAGSGGSNTSYTIGFTRIGNVVTLNYPSILVTTGGSANSAISTSPNQLPNRLIPTSNKNFPAIAIVSNSSADTVGKFTVANDGSFIINRTASGGTNWSTGNANNGLQLASVTYTTA